MTKADLRLALGGRPVGSFEHGSRVPTTDDILRLALALQMPPGFFMKRSHSDLEGGMVFVCTRGATRLQRPRACHHCGETATRMCDGRRKSGAPCNRAMCRKDTTHVGPNFDLCRRCIEADAQLAMPLA